MKPVIDNSETIINLEFIADEMLDKSIEYSSESDEYCDLIEAVAFIGRAINILANTNYKRYDTI
jgi:hypothetical protein